MAHIRFRPTIETADIAWLGEAANYNTLMPHGAIFNPVGIPAIDAATLTTDGVVDEGAELIILAEPLNNGTGIPAGMTLMFGELPAVTKDWASPSSSEIIIYPFSGLLNAGVVCEYPGFGSRPLRDGTAVGRTFEERDAGAPFGLADDNDDEIYLTGFAVTDLLTTQEITLVRPGTKVKENRIPGFSEYGTRLQNKLRGIYTMYIGT